MRFVSASEVLIVILTSLVAAGFVHCKAEAKLGAQKQKAGIVYVVPIRQDIAKPLVFLVRRAVKEAIAAGADLLILDMETNGGYVDDTLEIIDILERFPGKKVTYVNRTAYSAGAFIAVATHEIYMAPESVIGAAAPVFIGPGGTGPAELPTTFEAKITSAIRARIRAYAQKYGHNPDVIEAMVDKEKELVIDGEVVCAKGEILTLTNLEAERQYGTPPRPLLSSGTVENISKLIERLGYSGAKVVFVHPSGMEELAKWLAALSWLWLMIGIAGLYIEMKTPGFGLPGAVGLLGFFLYFAGGYFAGLTGLEWVLLFVLGLVLIGLEIFVWPGTTVLGLTGAVAALVSLFMAFVDVYPSSPPVPRWPELTRPVLNLLIALIGSVIVILILRRLLPATPIYRRLVAESVSAAVTVSELQQWKNEWLGREGIAITPLRPSGKAQFGETVLDVNSSGDFVEPGKKVRIVDFSGRTPVVEEVIG